MMSALRLALPIEARSKSSSRTKDRDELAEMIKEDAKPWLDLRGRFGTTWPRARASIALDLRVSSNRKQSPRIDKICKWLLDELGGPNSDAIVFKDDKQVKLLFAIKSVYGPPEKIEVAPDDPWAPGLRGMAELPEPKPTIHLVAQRLSLTLDGVRRARSLDPPWDPKKVHDSPFGPRDFETELDEDYLRELHPDFGGFQQEEWDRVTAKLAFTRQMGHIKALDHLSALAITELATDKHGLYEWLIPPMRSNPYAFDLGPIPEAAGDTERFKRRITELMTERVHAYPHLFPLRPIVGVTVLYFESGQGKDLDNLVRSLVPEVIRHFQPPDEDQFFWSADSKIAERLRTGQASPTNEIRFIEAVALTQRPPSVAPGTAFLLISDGWRQRSWWESALDYEEKYDPDY
ncbi:hypothetical protein [Leifsonia sp. NPDC058248]|uniref:hypothetical protein n=1 Tax=Leifsonia sp. NPDC058248 TaxID=3346402 RepID=UPI0036DB40A2